MQSKIFFRYCAVVFFWALSSCLLFANNEYRLLIDIPSYNNKDWYAKNLQSVLDQVGHTNYLAVITDDCSPDGTGDLVERFIKEKKCQDHIMLIKNAKRRGALANHYHVIQMAKDDDIIVQLDGDDFFKTPSVFTYLNDLYKNKDLWWTYGVYENWPDSSMKSFSRPLTEEDGITRKTVPFVFGPIRSYRAWFAKRIKLEDLIADFDPCMGKFYASAGDFALVYPLLEMSGAEHLHYIDQILYTRNIATPINDFKVNKNLQEKCARAIKDKQPYNPLFIPPFKPVTASVFVFDTNKDAQQLETCLASVRMHISNYRKVTVVYSSAGLTCLPEYQKLMIKNSDFSWVDFDAISDHAGIKYALRTGFADYVLMLNSLDIIKQPIDVIRYATMLKNTSAYTLLFGRHFNGQPMEEWFDEDLYVWKFSANRGKIAEHVLNGALYKFSDVITLAKNMRYGSINEFVAQWMNAKADSKKVGLYVYPARVESV